MISQKIYAKIEKLQTKVKELFTRPILSEPDILAF